MKAEILVPDGSSEPGVALADELSAAGYEVRHCYRARDTGIACAAERGRPCPIEEGHVDLVVVPQADGSRSQGMSDGARCALRRKIPVLMPALGPGTYRRWGAAAGSELPVTAAVEKALGEPLLEHSHTATTVVYGLLPRHGLSPAGVTAKVWRRDGRLVVRVASDAALPMEIRRVISIRLPAELRKIDPWAAGMDVSILPAD